MSLTTEQLLDKVNSKLVQSGDCLIWTGALSPKGYGVVRLNNKTARVHRAVYELTVGPIPRGMIIRHTCDNPPCANVEHLLLGTHGDNANDKVDRRRNKYEDQHPLAKLTRVIVDKIRIEYATGKYSQRFLADKYSVHQSTISYIVTNKLWNKEDSSVLLGEQT